MAKQSLTLQLYFWLSYVRGTRQGNVKIVIKNLYQTAHMDERMVHRCHFPSIY